MSRVLIIGGGPVGLVAALHAREAGLEAVVFDRARPPIDKGCGEGLMPGAMATLHDLGVHIDPDGCSPFRGVRYIDGALVADGDFPGPPGMGVRRLHLHRGLVARAQEKGVDLRWGCAVEGLVDGGVRCATGPEQGSLVLAADGLHSPTRKQLGLKGPAPHHSRFGLRRHFAMPPWSDRVEVHWADGCEAYVTPVGPNRVGVAMLWSGGKARFPDLLQRFPALVRRLKSAAVDSQVRGAGPLHQRTLDVVASGPGAVPVMLIGDAAGYVDAITGEGMSLGFHQAQAAIRAFTEGDPAGYRRARQRLVRVPNALIHLLLWVKRYPWLRRRMVAALSREPALFSKMLQVNDGAASAFSLVPGGPRLLLRMATATPSE